MADDLGYGHLGSYGQDKIATPHLDRLAAEGLRFTHAYAGGTVCAPSRAALLTGLHTGHAPIRGNRAMHLRSETITIADVMKHAGYATAVIGKWGFALPELAWSFPTRYGFDEFLGFLDHRSAQFRRPATLWRNEQEVAAGDYSDDLFTAEAVDFVTRHAGRPFLLYLAYTIPHPAVMVPADSMKPYRFDEVPYTDARFGLQARPKAALAGMITRLDGSVGRLVALLRRLGIERDTLVLFTSDNGAAGGYLTSADFFEATGGLRGYKDDLYEGGIRVPMIAWWPGTIAPGETGHVVAHWDLMPTLAELAGTEPVATDGLSLVPLLRGRPQPEHAYLYWEQHGITTAQAVRFGPWKALRAAPDAPVELYDLRGDGAETVDLAASRPDLVDAAIAYMDEAHEPSRAWPLVEQSLWTRILQAKSRLGAWAREGQAYGRWYGMLATVYDRLTSN